MGRRTFSSAILNTYDFLNHTSAITIGEQTSGKLNHFGEVRHFDLPHSQLRIWYSTKYFNIDPKNSNAINPSIGLPITFSDYNNGIDPVYEYVSTLN